MWNIILDRLPTQVSVNDVEYDINPGFRNILRIIKLLEDDTFTERERQIAALALFFCNEENRPEDPTTAYAEMHNFIDCYRSEERNGKKKNVNVDDYYNFDSDSTLIFNAFMQQYHIDLTETNMHWFKFITLFEGLNDGTPQFVRVVGYRSIQLTAEMSAKERAFYAEKKMEYELPKYRKRRLKAEEKHRKRVEQPVKTKE